jgi:hypothetical protein
MSGDEYGVSNASGDSERNLCFIQQLPYSWYTSGMKPVRAFLLSIACCAVVVALAGPAGRLAVVLPLLLLAPGYLVTRALRAHLPDGPAPQLALWIGLSLSVIALLYQWITAVGLGLTLPALQALAAGCGLAAFWFAWRDGSGEGDGESGRWGERETRKQRGEETSKTIEDQQEQDGYITSSFSRASSAALHPSPAVLRPSSSILRAPPFALRPSPAALRRPSSVVRRPSFVLVPALALLGVFALTLWLRFEQIKPLALPAWVDSVHHALLIRVAAERGQAPYSLTPYMQIENLPYHWGYHVFTAATLQLSGVTLPQVMLWGGQTLNALHVLTCAALAIGLWRRQWAGVVAGIVVGLLSIMPAYYVSWGRYTQLTGLLLLPALALAWSAGLRKPGFGWTICGALLIAGLSVIHFRVLVFSLMLIAAISFVWAIDHGWAQIRPRLWHALISIGLSIMLTLPWNFVLLSQRLAPAARNPAFLVSDTGYNQFSESLLWSGQNRLLVALALVGALLGLARRSRAALALIGWVGGLFVLADPQLITYIAPAAGIPALIWGYQRRSIVAVICGAALTLINPLLVSFPSFWLINQDAVIISLFVPLSALIGGGLLEIGGWGSGVRGQGSGIRGRGSEEQGDGERGRTGDMETGRHGDWETNSSPLHPFTPSPLHPFRIWLPRILAILLIGAAVVWGVRDLQGPAGGVINTGTIIGTQADLSAIDWVISNTPPDARFLINAQGWLAAADRGTDGGWWLLPLANRWTSTPPAIYAYHDYHAGVELRERNDVIINFEPGDQQAVYEYIEREGITHIYLGAQPSRLTADVFSDDSMFTKVYERDGVTILAVNRQS